MKFCKLDIKKATVNTVLQQAIYEAIVSKTTGRYKYEIIDDNYTIKITGKRSTNPKSPYKIADELVSRINSYKPDILRVVKTREDDQSPILLEVYVNPDYINQKFDSLPEEQKNHVNVDLSRDINFFNGDNSLMEQERKWDSDDELQFQKFTSQHTEGQVVSEKTIRDLAARISDRIGIPYKIISDRTQKYKGKIENGVAYINLAYADLSTPIHEILSHPIIRAIKNKTSDGKTYKLPEEMTDGSGWAVQVYTENDFEPEFFKTKKEAFDFYNSKQSYLYKNLLKELETGKGKEVLDRIKKDYNFKTNNYKVEENWDGRFLVINKTTSDKGYGIFDSIEEAQQKLYNLDAYTLEEQQEEAVVELLGLMTADKLDAVKDGKLISLLKRLLKEIKAFIKDLLKQHEIEIDKLPDNLTIGDLSDILAYSNSKLILAGYTVEYTTPDNQTFKTYQEASNHISELAKNVKDVDLDDVNLNIRKKVEKASEIPVNKFVDEFDNTTYNKKDGKWYVEDTNRVMLDDDILTLWNSNLSDNYVNKTGVEGFIEKNKEYEQSKEIIEEWKKVNNIQYNPEEVYSRGQEFSSVVGAYSSFDVNLMMQNLLSHIEDNEKAGGKFAISAYTKPVDKQIGHLEGGGGKIKFKIYPQSQDILWAANTDVFSGSVWDASEKVSKDKKSELLGVSYTKYPSLRSINEGNTHLEYLFKQLKIMESFEEKDFKNTTKKTIDWAKGLHKYTNIQKGISFESKENDVEKALLENINNTKELIKEQEKNNKGVQANLASIIDNLSHHHNELAISLNFSNFEIEVDEDVPYQTKKIIENVNKILQQKRLEQINNFINKLEKEC